MVSESRSILRRPRFWRRYSAVGLGLVVGFGISGWLAWELHRDARRRDEARFELETKQISAILEQEMERYEERLGRLADFCARVEPLSLRVLGFRSAVVTDFSYNLPSVMYAVYCPKVLPEDFQRHLAYGREAWGDRYVFDPGVRPDRPFALPVYMHYSRSTFPRMKPGTDMAESAAWHPALGESMRRSTWISADPVQVPREDGSMETGFWFTHSLFADDQQSLSPWQRPGESNEERVRRNSRFLADAAKGVLGAFVSTDRMVDAAFNHPDPPKRVHVRLYASKDPSPVALLNPRSPPPGQPRHRRVIRQKWYTRTWCLEMASTPHFEMASPRYRAWLALVGGSSLTLLACGVAGLSIRARVRLERIMDEVMAARDALAAAEKERERLGHDLHDGAIQSLYAVQLGLTKTGESLAPTDRVAARWLQDTRERINNVIAELRGFILSSERGWESGPSIGLDQVLAAMVRGLQPTTTAQLRLDANPAAASLLSPQVVVQLTQLTRSALANCLRHAQARQVAISLQAVGDSVVLVVEDDGIGFDPAQPRTGGIGLRTMEARAADVGGTLKIESRPGSGTRVAVTVPATCPVPPVSGANP